MKYDVYKDWMVGRRVMDLTTGDLGIVSGPVEYDSDSVYVNWKTGNDAGMRLWLSLDSLEFFDECSYSEQDWQPIETAPKDGTKVDLWAVSETILGKTECRIIDCWWYSDSLPNWVYDSGMYGLKVVTGATHWKPITFPPNGS